MNDKSFAYRLAHRLPFHYGWLILGAMCCNCLCCFMSVYIGMLAGDVAESIGETRGVVMQLMMFFSVSFVIFSPIWGFLHGSKKVPEPVVMGLAYLVQIITLILLATAQSLPQIYAVGFCQGIVSTGIMITPNGIFAAKWFADKSRGRLLGIAFSFAGIAAIVWPPLITWFVSIDGWRFAAVMFAVISAVLLFPWVPLYRRSPESLGLAPLSIGSGKESSQEEDPNANRLGVGLKRALKNPILYLLIFSVMCLSSMQGYENNLTAIVAEDLSATEWSMSAAAIAAVVLSVDGFFDLIANFLIGVAIDKVGLRKAVTAWLFVFVLFFIILIWFGFSPIMLYIAGACFGLHTCIRRTALPLIVRGIYGPRNYAKIFGIVSAGTGLVNGLSSSLIAITFDLTGSFALALFIGLALSLLTFVFVSISLSFIGKLRWTESDEEEALESRSSKSFESSERIENH